jgi:hypothetical protein
LQKSIYKFDTERVVSVWLLPFLFGCFILIALIWKIFDYEVPITLVDVIIFCCLLFFTTGTSIILFFNHLPYANDVKLIVSDNEIEIITNEKSVTINLKDVEAIYEYGDRRVPWMAIRKWTFITSNDKFVISSLTISWLDFHRHFWNRIINKGFGFPLM